MANLKHLAKLREGVDAWNTWRMHNWAIRPDFHEADLGGANLAWANLGGAYFSDANLSNADLRGVNFGGANLSRANLSEAYLSGVNLGGAFLGGVNLSRANLSEAYLGKASLRGANLDGASLVRANLERANLDGVDLVEVNLEKADLSEVNLERSNLSRANLGGVNLSRANLGGADLGEVNLSKAYLGEVNLSSTDLSGANLSEANLSGADLGGANLGGVNFTRAVFRETIFANVNLMVVKGLDSCFHHGPSIIDHRTFKRSGKLPLSFLRGCGLPDTLIDYLPSLLNQPIQFYSCFISYSSKDEAFAQRLHADLQDKGIRCWFAPENMKIGDKIRTRIDEVIRIHDKLLLVLSQNSVVSGWVEKEVETAFDKEIERKEPVLFPIRLDTAVMESKTGWAADIRRSRHIGDFCNWKNHDEYQKGLERLLRDLRVEQDPE